MTMSDGTHTALSAPQVDSIELALPDILRDALGQVLSQERRHWRREHELIAEMAHRTIAELRTEIVVMRSNFDAEMRLKLAALRDGEQGPQGERGLTGERGDRGEAGERGEPGARGNSGEQGERGERGLQGEQGPVGERGLTGERGEPGERGLTGERGERGEQGERGLQGEQGPVGERGEQGERGNHGEQGSQGEKGDTGGVGPQGVAGPAGSEGPAGGKGETGERGEKGEPGTVGPQGDFGLAGNRGLQGERGEPGAVGERGPAGERGEPGAMGALPLVKLWRDGEVHYQGDVVAHAGATWQALKDTGRAPGHRDWIALAVAGRDAISPQVRGTHDEQAEYRALDIVSRNGGSFIAKQDNPGVCPGEGWQCLTMPGKRGDPGGKGERGGKGDPGPAGAVITGWKVDRERYTATPIMSDGTSGSKLDLRVLFEQFQRETK